MENRTKRGLELSAAIIALIYCVVDLIIEIIDLISIGKYFTELGTGFILGFIIGICLVVAELVLAIKLLIDKSNPFIKGIRIAFIVISSVLTLFLFISFLIGTVGGIGWIALTVFIVVLVLESISFGMKDTKNTIHTQNLATAESSVEDKIKELKHLLDLYVISQEEYESAVDKIVKKLI